MAKKANILITSVQRKKYKDEKKLQKEIDKINALVADLNNIRLEQAEILERFDNGSWKPFEEYTLESVAFKNCLQEQES